jgi:hypothetical protein
VPLKIFIIWHFKISTSWLGDLIVKYPAKQIKAIKDWPVELKQQDISDNRKSGKSIPMKKMATTLLKAGFIAGSLDILLAFVNAWLSSGVSPERVLRFIASGLIGTKAFQDPDGMALLGLAIHFFIAFFWTAVFFFCYPICKGIVRSKFMQGVLYGIFVWLIMNVVVLPVTNTPKSGFQWSEGTGILIIAIGFPVAHFTRIYYQEKEIILNKK